MSRVNKFNKYVDCVDNFLESEQYSILFEMEDGRVAKTFRNRVLKEFCNKPLLIRQRKNFVHIEKMVE